MKRVSGGVSLWATSLFICGVLLMLFVVMMFAPSEAIEICGTKVRIPTLASLVSNNENSFSVEGQLSEIEAEMVMTASDSVRVALEDSIAFLERYFQTSPNSISFPQDNLGYLFPLFKALEGADSSVVHIMHYGDSQIEGDRITHLLRDSLQRRFGGNGPGLLPLYQPIPRADVSQTLTGHADPYYGGGIMGERAAHKRYGAMAQMAELQSDSGNVVMNVTARQKGERFSRVVAFVGHVGEEGLSVSLGDDARGAEEREGLQTISWRFPSRQSIDLSFAGQGDVYGIELDEGRGVSVSNIPLRGADGTFISRIDGTLMGDMLRRLNTRLVILEFGGNALPALTGVDHIGRWVKSFGAQIDKVQSLCPKAQILVIGPADMCVKEEGELQTHPLLEELVRQMKETSLEHGVAYWDMYSVMGGRNSMIAWAEHQPAWAATDYIHFTRRGADKIATILWKVLSMNYNLMTLRNQIDNQ